MTAVVTEPQTLQELLERVEADAALTSAEMQAEALISYIPEQLVKDSLLALAERLLSLRQLRGTGNRFTLPAPMRTIKSETVQKQRRPDAGTSARQKRVERSGHASPKVALATKAWNELLETRIAFPGMSQKVAIADMTSEQLHSLADSLYDTHEQVHRLAEHLSLNGVRCARELEPAALEACMSEVAA